jgi:hypothetical protein
VLSVVYAGFLHAEVCACSVSFMLSFVYAEFCSCWVSFMLSFVHVGCHLCRALFILGVVYSEFAYADCHYAECCLY